VDFSLADSLDYPLRYEHLLGVGLVAAQLYLVGVAEERGAPRRQALSIGPRHASGIALVDLINHGANYWKHADEWDYEAPDARRDRILDAFAKVGMADDDISLYGLLAQVVGSDQPRLLDLSPILEQWRDALDEAFPADPKESAQ
jgi:hypothetical protein